MSKSVSWTALKERQARLQLPFDWIEEPTYYRVVIADFSSPFFTRLEKDVSDPDTLDFENNFKNNPQTIGDSNQRINVTSTLENITVDSFPCPSIVGTKWRSELSTSDITLSTSSFTQLKSVSGSGMLKAFILDFTSDRVDIRLTIDGQNVFTIDFDDLEGMFPGGGSDGGPSDECIMWTRTGSRFTFCPPCGLSFSSNFTISAKGETNNRRLDKMLTHYCIN